MGLREGAGSEGEDRRPRGLAILLALLALGLSIAPSVAAIHEWTGQQAGSSFEHCEGAWSGYQGKMGLLTYRLCYAVDYSYPTLPLHDLRTLELPPPIETEDCPGDFEGLILQYWGTRAGLCGRAEAQAPTNPWAVRASADTTACELPDRSEEGRDPVIFLFDGGLAFCVVPIFESEKIPDVEISAEPCEPESVDPEVRIDDGNVEVCADFHVFGIGSQEANLIVQEANRTIAKTIQFGNDTVSMAWEATA